MTTTCKENTGDTGELVKKPLSLEKYDFVLSTDEKVVKKIKGHKNIGQDAIATPESSMVSVVGLLPVSVPSVHRKDALTDGFVQSTKLRKNKKNP